MEEENEKLILVLLRDGKTFRGILKAFDHFGNLLLDRAVQRLYHPTDLHTFADLYVGCMIVRGENVVLFGSLSNASIGEHLEEVACSAYSAELPAVLRAQDDLHASERVAEAVWTEYKQKLAAVPPGFTLEDHFIATLLAQNADQSSTEVVYTTQDIDMARNLWYQWFKTAQSALSLLESKRAACLENE